MLMTVIAAAVAAAMTIVVASAVAVVVEQLGWIVTKAMKTCCWKISRVIIERHRIDCCRCCRRRLSMMMRRDFREENSLLFYVGVVLDCGGRVFWLTMKMNLLLCSVLIIVMKISKRSK